MQDNSLLFCNGYWVQSLKCVHVSSYNALLFASVISPIFSDNSVNKCVIVQNGGKSKEFNETGKRFCKRTGY